MSRQFFARIRLKNETYYNILSAVEHKEPPNWFISQNEETRVVLSLFFQNLFIATADFFCILLIFHIRASFSRPQMSDESQPYRGPCRTLLS